MRNFSNYALWVIFVALLMVLLPHTAWWFVQFQDPRVVVVFGAAVQPGVVMAWFAAAVFEGTIAAYTHKLSRHIEQTPNFKDAYKRFVARYVNSYGGILAIAWFVSTVANYAYALEYARPTRLFIETGLPVEIGAAISGGILPLCSALFARTLSNVRDGEQEVDESEQEARNALREANRKIKGLNTELEEVNGLLSQVNVYRTLFDESVSANERIHMATELLPDRSQSFYGQLLNVSKSYVSQVFSENGFRRTDGEQE